MFAKALPSLYEAHGNAPWRGSAERFTHATPNVRSRLWIGPGTPQGLILGAGTVLLRQCQFLTGTVASSHSPKTCTLGTLTTTATVRLSALLPPSLSLSRVNDIDLVSSRSRLRSITALKPEQQRVLVVGGLYCPTGSMSSHKVPFDCTGKQLRVRIVTWTMKNLSSAEPEGKFTAGKFVFLGPDQNTTYLFLV